MAISPALLAGEMLFEEEYGVFRVLFEFGLVFF